MWICSSRSLEPLSMPLRLYTGRVRGHTGIGCMQQAHAELAAGGCGERVQGSHGGSFSQQHPHRQDAHGHPSVQILPRLCCGERPACVYGPGLRLLSWCCCWVDGSQFATALSPWMELKCTQESCVLQSAVSTTCRVALLELHLPTHSGRQQLVGTSDPDTLHSACAPVGPQSSTLAKSTAKMHACPAPCAAMPVHCSPCLTAVWQQTGLFRHTWRYLMPLHFMQLVDTAHAKGVHCHRCVQCPFQLRGLQMQDTRKRSRSSDTTPSTAATAARRLMSLASEQRQASCDLPYLFAHAQPKLGSGGRGLSACAGELACKLLGPEAQAA